MLDKYFGFTKIQDEFSVVDSLLEHARIDRQELMLLSQLIQSLNQNTKDNSEVIYEKIQKISQDSSRLFEHISGQIIQANFDHQKQYDLLRLYQRIESISTAILESAHSGAILYRIDGKIPLDLFELTTDMTQRCLQIQQDFEVALVEYQKNKKQVFNLIHVIIDKELQLHEKRTECLQRLYQMGNEGALKVGDFRAIENLIHCIGTLGHTIVEAATSLEWLLMDSVR